MKLILTILFVLLNTHIATADGINTINPLLRRANGASFDSSGNPIVAPDIWKKKELKGHLLNWFKKGSDIYENKNARIISSKKNVGYVSGHYGFIARRKGKKIISVSKCIDAVYCLTATHRYCKDLIEHSKSNSINDLRKKIFNCKKLDRTFSVSISSHGREVGIQERENFKSLANLANGHTSLSSAFKRMASSGVSDGITGSVNYLLNTSRIAPGKRFEKTAINKKGKGKSFNGDFNRYIIEIVDLCAVSFPNIKPHEVQNDDFSALPSPTDL